ncbi:unnamed protein product, partial [Owenia fusiformis]
FTTSAQYCEPTTEDVLGPFYKPDTSKNDHICMRYQNHTFLPKITMTGHIKNVDCEPVNGVKVEIWQTDDEGKYHNDQTCRGYVVSENNGSFSFETIHPGRYKLGDHFRPSHIHMLFTKPGYHNLITQIYFEGDQYLGENDGCPPAICHSDDQRRIIGLKKVLSSKNFEGTFEVVLENRI